MSNESVLMPAKGTADGVTSATDYVDKSITHMEEDIAWFCECSLTGFSKSLGGKRNGHKGSNPDYHYCLWWSISCAP